MIRLLLIAAVLSAVLSGSAQTTTLDAKRALGAKQYSLAKRLYTESLRTEPRKVESLGGRADAEMGLHEYSAAELDYRAAVAVQPQLWIAHKNLVVVEAALGRWDEFDRERAVLRGARQRGEPGISARESDVIDTFIVGAQLWIVREYFEPAGRSQVRYNFEHFSKQGKAEQYISLESEQAASQATVGDAVKIGEAAAPAKPDAFALNWYTGKAHGAIATYPGAEPGYEDLRRTVQHWLLSKKTASADGGV